MTDDEFERYRQRIGGVLARCNCDELFLGVVCENCIALTEKFLAEEKRHIEQQKASRS